MLTAAILFVLVASGVHSARTGSDTLTIIGNEIEIIDWMYALAVLFVGVLVIARLRSAPALVIQLFKRARGQLLVAINILYVLVLLVAASITPYIISEPEIQPLRAVQPPVWSSVPETALPICQATVSEGVCPGTMSAPFGTNALGQGMIKSTLLSLNTTFQVAVTASVIAATLGITVGVIAGYYRGRVDEFLMRYVDIQRALPAFFVYILLILIFSRSYALMILVFGLISWGGIARLVRSEVMQLRTAPYVRAARLSGANSALIIRRHILPAITGTVLTAVAMLFAKFMIYEAALSFLSLTDSSVASIGNDITTAIGREAGDPTLDPGRSPKFSWTKFPWLVYLPGGVLGSLLLAVSLLSDTIEDLLDPRE
ncbi:ABC transporter permease [Halovenus salina]